ncbi:MAG: ABC transporter ATP-binding protein [Alphaproteobacteria bacterium]|nr:ABC transporter ATP-binding protein [Alphaproteobacteria bacterium]
MSFVEIENVSLRYKPQGDEEGTLAVEDLNLSVEKGSFVAVVGPSGCGKSSLMKLATGLNFPTSGKVTVAGQDVHGPVSITGMAFQNPVMLPWRLTRDNIMLPLEVVEPHRRTFRRDKAANRERVDALLASVGLEGQGSKYPWQLSGGMQQRASLCRALIHEPELLMLDEPFGALDAFTREELWQVIRDLHAERKFTTILVTHDLREAVFLADKVFVMSARPGRVIVERDVDLPRPRDIDLTYEKSFGDIVQELRSHIAKARE